MKILIITPYLPYPAVPHGGGANLFRVIEHFSPRHDVHLASMYEPEEARHLSELTKYVPVAVAVEKDETRLALHLEWLEAHRNPSPLWRLHRTARDLAGWIGSKVSGIIVRPHADEAKFISQVMAKVDELRPDLVQVEYTRFGRIFGRLLKDKFPAVVVAHDVDFKPLYRAYKRLPFGIEKLQTYIQYRFVRYVELESYKNFGRVYTVSEVDRQWLLKTNPSYTVAVRPSAFMKTQPPKQQSRHRHRIIFVAAMYRDVNIEAALFMLDKVWPSVKRACPHAAFHIIGADPPAEILARHNGTDIFVRGFVENLSEEYLSARAMVAPLFLGGGFITKIFEALWHGMPVVSTTIANEGISAAAEKSILLADSAGDFIKQLIRLLTDDDLCERLSKESTAFLQSHYDVEKILVALEQGYHETIAAFKSEYSASSSNIETQSVSAVPTPASEVLK